MREELFTRREDAEAKKANVERTPTEGAALRRSY